MDNFGHGTACPRRLQEKYILQSICWADRKIYSYHSRFKATLTLLCWPQLRRDISWESFLSYENWTCHGCKLIDLQGSGLHQLPDTVGLLALQKTLCGVEFIPELCLQWRWQQVVFDCILRNNNDSFWLVDKEQVRSTVGVWANTCTIWHQDSDFRPMHRSPLLPLTLP